MLALATMLHATEPSAPPPPPSVEELERLRQEDAAHEKELSAVKEKDKAPATDDLSESGGYVLVSPGVSGSPDPGFAYSLEGGGWFGGLPSFGVGLRFEHLVSDGSFHIGAPIRIAFGRQKLAGYGTFAAAAAVISECVPDTFPPDCKTAGRPEVAAGLGVLFLAWRGLTLGAEATFHTIFAKQEVEFSDPETVTLNSVVFRLLLGWKFGVRGS